MSLSVGLSVARSALSVTAEQTAVISRNVANAGDTQFSRKNANVITAANGGVRVMSITRAADQALFDKMVSTRSLAAGQDEIVKALNRLDETINDPELDASPSALIGKLNDAIQLYASAPQDPVRGQAAVGAAADLARSLNEATRTVQSVRDSADGEIARSVESLNRLLGEFKTINDSIKRGTAAGVDVTDQLDQRDRLLTSISQEIGVRTIVRGDNDMVIYTDSGVTLFETAPRSVTFDRSLTLPAGATGNAIHIDGVPVTGPGAGLAAKSGRLVGLMAVRDDITVTYQNQLDEIARGLIETFAESDQSAVPTLPDIPGLFTYSGAPAMPASGSVLQGLAGSIRINPNVDPSQGGSVTLLRDGGIGAPGNPAYVYNASGAAGFSDRLQQLVDVIAEDRVFDPDARLDTPTSLGSFASLSVGWLQEGRKAAGEEADFRQAVLERSTDALSRATGVNLDEEMTILLELERSYQASTRLVATIDAMLESLLAATG